MLIRHGAAIALQNTIAGTTILGTKLKCKNKKQIQLQTLIVQHYLYFDAKSTNLLP